MTTIKLNENLFVHESFYNFLQSTSGNRISSMILSLPTLPEINYIKNADKNDMVSYLPYTKNEKLYLKLDEQNETVINNGGSLTMDNYIDPYNMELGRTELRIGRLVSKLFTKEHMQRWASDSEIEKFVNAYKSFFDSTNVIFKVISGNEIKKYYQYDSYYSPFGNRIGTLWNSCMRHPEKQSFLDLYAMNSQVKMLIMLVNENGQEKLRARALLWDAEIQNDKNPLNLKMNDKIKLMDRIYTVFDSDVLTFKTWARENGYIPKFLQNAKSQNILDINDKPIQLNLKCKLDIVEFKYYPYLDTLPYLNYDIRTLYNNKNKSYDYTLIQADGRIHREEQYVEDEPDIDGDDTFL